MSKLQIESTNMIRLFAPDCPLDVLAVTVLRDPLQEQRFLRARFQNVSEQTITSFMICFHLTTAQENREIRHLYSGLKLKSGGIGGMTVSIPLGKESIGSVFATVEEIGYLNGTVQEDFSSDVISYETGERIPPVYKEAYRYIAGKHKGLVLSRAVHLYYPKQFETGAYVCSCGRYCPGDTQVCPRCLSEKKSVFEVADQTTLEQTKEWLDSVHRKTTLLAHSGKQRFENQQAEQTRAKRKKAIIVAVVLIILAVLSGMGVFYYSKEYYPKQQYQTAQNLLEQQEYARAYQHFCNAKQYKDAAAQAKQAAILRDRKSVAYVNQSLIAVSKQGTVTVFSDDPLYQQAQQWTDIVSVAAGKEHVVGLRSDGSVVSVGKNVYGECNVSDYRDIVSVAAGPYHTVLLKRDGTVAAIGYQDDKNQVLNVLNWKNIVTVTANATQTMALDADGNLYSTVKRPPISDSDLYYEIDCSGMEYAVGLTRSSTVVDSEQGKLWSGEIFHPISAKDVVYAIDGKGRVRSSSKVNYLLQVQQAAQLIPSQSGEVFCVTKEGKVYCTEKLRFYKQLEELGGIGAMPAP